jgi:predicted chitinase
MPNIIGEEIEGYVASQIKARQILHGSGANAERNTNQLNVLNSQTSWIKLASGVSVDSDRLKEIGVDESFHGMGLAKNNVLFGGTSKVEKNRTIQREGLQPQNPNSSYTYGEFGYVPMAGVIGASIKTLNRGSLKKASVKLKVHDREQFEIIDLLYLRLGYTVLLEWGNSIFTPDGSSKEILRGTLIDESTGFFNSGFASGRSYLDILPRIEEYRNKWEGNYDGLLGKVSNFDWSFNEDGSYDINLTIISLGDVIESLKTNISVDKESSNFLKIFEDNPPKTTDPPEEDPIEDNKDSNAISFMLWAWKYTNKSILESRNPTITIQTPNDNHYVSQFLATSEELSITEVSYEFTIKKIYYDKGVFRSIITTTTKTFISDDTLYDEIQKEKKRLEFVSSEEGETKKIVTYKKQTKSSTTTSLPSPILEFGTKDAFVFLVKNEQYYLRFGALLDFIIDRIIPIIDSSPKKSPIFNIDTEQYYNWMYSVPNQVSLDPRVCIVRNSNFVGSGGSAVKIYDQILPFRAQDYVTDSPNLNKAYIMNIYLNFNFILDSLNSNADEKGNVNLYNFISSLCDGINKSLGGVNNLEPVIEETSNTLKIIDTTPIPGITKDSSPAYTLQLYGYDGVGSGRSRSNFIRKIDLKTAITPEYATMITVGATAGGYVKGTEATAFSRWNKGLKDRFKEEIIPSNPNSQKLNIDGIDEAEINYVTKFLDKYNGKHGIKGNISDGSSITKCDLSSDIIDSNISIVTEYYKYQQSQNKEGGGGTIGFIPFKLGLTMDGLAGIKIYNKLHVNTRFLPSNYGKTLDLIVTGVSHELNGNDWETQIEATVIPKTTQSKITQITIENIREDIQAVGAIVASGPTIKGKIPENKKNIITKIVELAKSKGIKDRERLTCILAVAGGETQWNPGKSESFSYSLPRARAIFGSRIPKKDQDALKLIPKDRGGSGTQEILANHLYGNRFRNKQNEGWKYRGRGMTQITFKSNYEMVQNGLINKFFPTVGNIVTNPDLVNNTDVSVAILVYGKIQAFFGDKLIEGDKAYLSDPVRVQATQNGTNGVGKRRRNSTTPNYANAIYAINNTPWVQDLIK